MTVSIAEWLYPKPPEQEALDRLNNLESLMDETVIHHFGELDKPRLIAAVLAKDTNYLNNENKMLCAECMRDMDQARHLLNNWKGVEVAYDVIAKVSFKRAMLLERFVDQERKRFAGQRDKPDELQKLIIGIVQSKPNISEKELISELEKQKGLGVIEDIEEDQILYDKKGKLKDAPISGLKDRLSRAKKKINSL